MLDALPTAINGQLVQQVLPKGKTRQQAIASLSSLEGYNLSQVIPASTIVQGRNLTASDAGSTNVVISQELTNASGLQMRLKPGDAAAWQQRLMTQRDP